MKIFIDESGSFAVPRNGSDGFCCVGALVVADTEWENLAVRFEQFRAVLSPDTDEVKGRALSDVAVRQVLGLLREVDAKLFVCATAGAFFTDEELNEAKERQAYYLGAHVTEKHLPGLRRQIVSLQARMRAMAPQGFLQLYLLTRLIECILRVTPEWRLVKGVDRLFLSSRFGYAHLVPRFVQKLVDFWSAFDCAWFAAIGPVRHHIGGKREE
jgi:hypothetical protein